VITEVFWRGKLQHRPALLSGGVHRKPLHTFFDFVI
jgi:hypothetical protein